MNATTEFLLWALSIQPGRLNETGYYDRKHNHFFCIYILDFLMFDENFNLAKGVKMESNGVEYFYSDTDMAVFVDKVKRIEANDEDIIVIPKFGQVGDVLLNERARDFISINGIDMAATTIWEFTEIPRR